MASGKGGGGALRGAKILQKIMASPLSVIKIVKYCGIRGGGGGIAGRQNPTKIKAPLALSLSLRLWGKYITYKQYNCILPVTVTKCTI